MPAPPVVPVPRAIIVVPARMPSPEITLPTTIVFDDGEATVSVVLVEVHVPVTLEAFAEMEALEAVVDVEALQVPVE